MMPHSKRVLNTQELDVLKRMHADFNTALQGGEISSGPTINNSTQKGDDSEKDK